MSKIDTTNWNEFKLRDIFEVKRPIARSQSNYEDGIIPFVASGNYNNGVLKYLQLKENEELDRGNCITVSPIDGSSFYQKDDFLGRGGAGSSIILLYNDNLNLYNGYFIATVIRTVCSKYFYSDMANKDTIGEEKIKLPIDASGDLDWSYMELYMKNIEATVSSSMTKLLSAKEVSCNSIDITNWGIFHIYDIFDIDSGNKFDGGKMTTNDPKINFVNRTGFNNGVVDVVDEIAGKKPYEKDLLTLSLGGALLGACFIQDKPFYTGQNVIVLTPKENILWHTKLFIATTITKESRNNYKAFIKELNSHIKTDFEFMLPIKPDGKPDYDYMESYMKSIETSVSYSLIALQTA